MFPCSLYIYTCLSEQHQIIKQTVTAFAAEYQAVQICCMLSQSAYLNSLYSKDFSFIESKQINDLLIEDGNGRGKLTPTETFAKLQTVITFLTCRRGKN